MPTDTLMKHTVATLALITGIAAPISAQVQGDSIRLQILPSHEWTYGQFVSVDPNQLTIGHAGTDQSFPVHTLGRIEVRRRKSIAGTILGWVFVNEVGVGLAAITSPREKSGTYIAAMGVGAGLGLCFGALELKGSPWRWKRVRLR